MEIKLLPYRSIWPTACTHSGERVQLNGPMKHCASLAALTTVRLQVSAVWSSNEWDQPQEVIVGNPL